MQFENWKSAYRDQCNRLAKGTLVLSKETREPVVVIPCWPYGDQELKSDEIRGLLGFVQSHFRLISWLIIVLFVMCIAVAADGYMKSHGIKHALSSSFHLIYSLGLICPLLLLSKLRGISSIVVIPGEFHVIWSAAGQVVNRHYFQLSNIQRLVLEPNASDPRKSMIRIDEFTLSEKKPFRFKLEVFADRSRWNLFLSAISQYNNKLDIDPLIYEYLIPDQKDPSYTELWLEALDSAPRGECLEPVAPGTVLRNGAYRIDCQIGKGGQGTAYLATVASSTVAEDVARKVVLKEYILPVYVDITARHQAFQRFEDEAKTLSQIDHPNIIKLEGFFVEDLRAYLVLEYIDGRSLKEVVLSQGALAEQTVVDIALKLCDVLENLHEQEPRIVHQDFTPDNLLWSGGTNVKLIDFMVARKIDDTAASVMVAGKHAYMPPEQFRGEASPLSDYYAFGATLYFLLTGEEAEPLTRSDVAEKYPEVAPSLAELIRNLTELEESARCQSIDDARTLLQRAGEELNQSLATIKISSSSPRQKVLLTNPAHPGQSEDSSTEIN